MAEVKYYDVKLRWKPQSNRPSPFVSARIECLLARNKEHAKERALTYFALAGNIVEVYEVVEL